MPQISETRADEARASRNSCGGWFRDPFNLCPPIPQPIPPLIALHIGESYLVRLAMGGEHD